MRSTTCTGISIKKDQERSTIFGGAGRRGAECAAVEARKRCSIDPNVFVEGAYACGGGWDGIRRQLEEREESSSGSGEEGLGTLPV